MKSDAWKELQHDRNKAIRSGQPSPLQMRLTECELSELAETIEKELYFPLEAYETFDIEEEKERYPKIKILSERLLQEIEGTFNFNIWCHHKFRGYGEMLKGITEFATKQRKRYPSRLRWKERGRPHHLAYTIAKILDAHGVKPTNYGVNLNRGGGKNAGKFFSALRVIFETLGLPCKDLRRRIIPRALKALAEEKKFRAKAALYMEEARNRAAAKAAADALSPKLKKRPNAKTARKTIPRPSKIPPQTIH